MKEIKQFDPRVTTVAEDESSCVVFGMPRAAIATGCVDDVVPLAKMADKIKQIVNEWEIGGITDE